MNISSNHSLCRHRRRGDERHRGGVAQLGYQVSGSDLTSNGVTDPSPRWVHAWAIGHREENIDGANAVVVSTAVRSDNPEVPRGAPSTDSDRAACRDARGTHAPEAGYCDCRTHGKTTDTSAGGKACWAAGGLDPTFVDWWAA